MEENNTVQEVFDSLNDEQKQLVYKLVGHVNEFHRMPTLLLNYEINNPNGVFGREADQDLFDTFTDIQKQMADILARHVLNDRIVREMIGD